MLTDEPVLEPSARLATALAQHGLPAESFIAVQHGQTITVPITADVAAAASSSVTASSAAEAHLEGKGEGAQAVESEGAAARL